jgi:probable phosphoglycerate mutase
MRNRYFLMRHGESLANVADKIVSLPHNGLEDFGLSGLGREQARLSAQASGLPSTTIVIASDFLRARQTAAAACEAIGAPPAQLHEGLRERAFGELEGKSGEDYHKVWAHDQKDSDHTLFGAESANALVKRLRAVLEGLEARHTDQDVLLVSHGDPLRFLQLSAANRPLTEHLQIKLFAPAEIRALEDLPNA